jgi:hypothetical protein
VRLLSEESLLEAEIERTRRMLERRGASPEETPESQP